MKYFYVSLFVVCSSLLLPSCGVSTTERERIVTVTILPQQQLAAQIAGNLYEVHCLVPQGASPESYDPTPSDLLRLSKSSAYFRIGYIGFELAWMERLEKNNRGMVVFDNSKGVELIRGGHVCTDPSSHDHSAEGFDPHIWSSPVQMRRVARNMCDAFVQLDPENAATYEANCAQVVEQIDETDHAIRAIVSTLSCRTFAIYHPSLGYFARDYGLEQLALEHEGKEPSAAHLQALLTDVKQKRVEVVFVQQEFDQKNAELIAREAGCRLVLINPLNKEWRRELITISEELRHGSNH